LPVANAELAAQAQVSALPAQAEPQVAPVRLSAPVQPTFLTRVPHLLPILFEPVLFDLAQENSVRDSPAHSPPAEPQPRFAPAPLEQSAFPLQSAVPPLPPLAAHDSPMRTAAGSALPPAAPVSAWSSEECAARAPPPLPSATAAASPLRDRCN
jgi:hypothetical protein